MTIGQLITNVTVQGPIQVRVFNADGTKVKTIDADAGESAESLSVIQPYNYAIIEYMYVSDGALTIEAFIDNRY